MVEVEQGGKKNLIRGSKYGNCFFAPYELFSQKKSNNLFLVESPQDAFYLSLLGFCCVAVGTNQMSISKVKTLDSLRKTYKFKRIIAIGDKGEAGEKLFKNLGSLPNVLSFNAWQKVGGKDIGEALKIDHTETIRLLEKIK